MCLFSNNLFFDPHFLGGCSHLIVVFAHLAAVRAKSHSLLQCSQRFSVVLLFFPGLRASTSSVQFTAGFAQESFALVLSVGDATGNDHVLGKNLTSCIISSNSDADIHDRTCIPQCWPSLLMVPTAVTGTSLVPEGLDSWSQTFKEGAFATEPSPRILFWTSLLSWSSSQRSSAFLLNKQTLNPTYHSVSPHSKYHFQGQLHLPHRALPLIQWCQGHSPTFFFKVWGKSYLELGNKRNFYFFFYINKPNFHYSFSDSLLITTLSYHGLILKGFSFPPCIAK